VSSGVRPPESLSVDRFSAFCLAALALFDFFAMQLGQYGQLGLIVVFPHLQSLVFSFFSLVIGFGFVALFFS